MLLHQAGDVLAYVVGPIGDEAFESLVLIGEQGARCCLEAREVPRHSYGAGTLADCMSVS